MGLEAHIRSCSLAKKAACAAGSSDMLPSPLLSMPVGGGKRRDWQSLPLGFPVSGMRHRAKQAASAFRAAIFTKVNQTIFLCFVAVLCLNPFDKSDGYQYNDLV
jgi:hypothetical protein